MMNLLKTEWLKLRKYPAFWGIIGITVLSYPGVSYIFRAGFRDFMKKPGQAGELLQMLLGNPFALPEAWHTLAYSSSIFVFIPSVAVIMFITNEYSFKTHRQNIIDGWGRNQFMTAKMIDVLVISLIATLLYVTVTLIIGLSEPQPANLNKWSHSYYAGLFLLQTFAQLSIAFLVGFLIRKAFIALGVFLFYFIVLENIGVALLHRYANDIGEYLPLEISDRMIPPPAFWGRFDKSGYEKSLAAINVHILYTVLLTGLIWVICYRINKRRDL
jgi:ABC-2 type transport system permease protein